MKLIYPAVFKPFSDQSGGYVVEFPDLPGCVTEGKDLEEAIEMGIDAASGWILGELEDGEQIPNASSYSKITAENVCMVNMLLLDIDAYKEYTQAISQAKENYSNLKERGLDAINGNVIEFMDNLLTPDEIAESDLRVSIFGELIKARQEKGISQKSRKN